MKNTLVLLAVLIICSCSENSSFFCENHKIINPTDSPDTLTGELIVSADTVDHIVGITANKNYLVATMDNSDKMYMVLSKNGEKQFCFGKKGHAGNEFKTSARAKQLLENNRLIVNDVNAQTTHIVCLDDAKDPANFKFEADLATPIAGLEVWYAGDSDLILLQQTNDNFVLTRTSSEYKSNVELFKPNIPSFPNYQSLLTANANSTCIAMPMVHLNQINFFDFTHSQKKSVSLYEDAKMPETRLPGTYYCSACTDGNLVYALYMNQNSKDSYSTEKSMEIHVFDYDGNYKGRKILPEYVVNITIDKDGFLYGLNHEGNIYKYIL